MSSVARVQQPRPSVTYAVEAVLDAIAAHHIGGEAAVRGRPVTRALLALAALPRPARPSVRTAVLSQLFDVEGWSLDAAEAAWDGVVPEPEGS